MVGSNCYLQDLPETCACTPRTKTRPQLVSPSSILHVCLSKLEGLARVTHKTSSLSSIRFFDYLILFPFRFHAPGWFQHETLHVGQSARLGFLPSLSPSSSALSPLLHFFLIWLILPKIRLFGWLMLLPEQLCSMVSKAYLLFVELFSFSRQGSHPCSGRVWIGALIK